jgi:acetoin utilization protein AcuC
MASHSPQFIAAIERANSGVWDQDMIHFNLGVEDCPVFPGLYDYVLLYTSATLTAVDLIINAQAHVVFNPLGGFHHASRNHAEGFCYVNDAIAAIDELILAGHRVAYIDIDAHHGNGVQDAYYTDNRVLTISIHESGKTLYPWSGFEHEIGEEQGQGFNINIPLPQDTDDEAYESIFERVVTPAIYAFQPSVVVAVIGADGHKSDPLANLKLTNNSMANTIKKIRSYSNHLLMLGGGGYDLKATSRAWTRMWAVANDIESAPEYLMIMGGVFIGADEFSNDDLSDMTFRITGDHKTEILAELERIATFHEQHTLSILQAHTPTTTV